MGQLPGWDLKLSPKVSVEEICHKQKSCVLMRGLARCNINACLYLLPASLAQELEAQLEAERGRAAALRGELSAAQSAASETVSAVGAERAALAAELENERSKVRLVGSHLKKSVYPHTIITRVTMRMRGPRWDVGARHS
jgi:hypothetical protein